MRSQSKGQHGPLCAVGGGVGEPSRETGMKPGGQKKSLSLTPRHVKELSHDHTNRHTFALLCRRLHALGRITRPVQ